MKVYINKNSKIENATSKKGDRPTLSIDGYALKRLDTICFYCEECEKYIEQEFRFREKFLNKEFLCGDCSKEKTNLKKYGSRYGFQSKKVKEKIKQTKLERYGNENFVNSEKAKKTNLNKYGVECTLHHPEIREKVENTKLKRYGDKNYNNRNKFKNTCEKRYGGITFQSPGLKEKVKQTNLKKYGVIYPQQNHEIKEKIKRINLKNYGVEHNFQRNEIKEKIKKTNLERYRAEYYQKSEISKEKRKQNFFFRLLNSDRLQKAVKPLFNIEEYNGVDDFYEWKCNHCDTIFSSHLENGNIPKCPKCYPPLNGTSKYENELFEWIQSLKIKNIIQRDRRLVKPYEIDLYLPDYKLAIEFNGLYWHSESQGKGVNYHLNKTLECEKQGIQLIHIFEDEWLNKQDIVKSVIKGKLGLNKKLYARKCVVKEVDNRKEFLEENHLQGFVNSKINIGLYHQSELVSILTFGKSRYDKQYDWELLRFANKLDISVVGGFAKMLRYFKSNYSGSIITYSDKRYFNGSIYKDNGFEKLKSTTPNYYYTDKRSRYSRIQFQKHKLEEQLEIYDPNLTEWQNMQLNGYDRIWDCGHYRFIKLQ